MKQRSVNTSLWEDEWFQDLEPTEKLLFSFLLTNPATNVAGIYEITIRTMEFYTGIKKKDIRTILNKFENDKKVFYIVSNVIMVNWLKHQKLNPNMRKSVETVIDNLKEEVTNSKGFELYKKIFKKETLIELP